MVGGAATTLGAAALMLPCQLTFFYKLGLLIFTTIFCSLVFSFGFVMPLLAAAGPSGDWCGFSLPGQKRHHGGRVAAAPESKASREAVGNLTVPPTEDPATMPAP